MARTIAAVLLIAVAVLSASVVGATVNLDLEVAEGFVPDLFADNMVVQQGVPIPIFGRADPGEIVSVRMAGQDKSGVADGDGRWRIDLDALAAGGPYDLTVEGSTNGLTMHNVLVGEVWLLSGQSNMAIRQVHPDEVAAYPNVRTLWRNGWLDRPATVPWLFGVKLSQALGVPVGVLQRPVGGSLIRSWAGRTALEDPDTTVAPLLTGGRLWGQHYAQKIKPLQPYAIRGVAWWQGESDERRPVQHRTLLPAVIRSWRREWGQGDFPFLFVQTPKGLGMRLGELPSRLPRKPSRSHRCAFMRQSYLLALSEPTTSMIVSIDFRGRRHPRNLDDYAQRLVNHALALIYGEELVYSGPIYSSMAIEGSSIRLRFRAGTAQELFALGGDLQGFAITDDLDTWYWAGARIEGNEVVVSSSAVEAPLAARYAWGRRTRWANLFNGDGQGAAAFSTEASPGEYQP